MSYDSLEDAVQGVKVNADRIDVFVNGTDTESYVTSDGRTVPSLPKFIKDNQDLLDGASAEALALDLASTDAGKGAAMIGVKRPIADAVAVTLLNWIAWQAVNVREFGVTLDGVTNDTAAWAKAAASGRHLYWPDGASYVTNQVTLQNGQVLIGAGRTRSYFVIDGSFNMAASGVLKLGTAEPGAQAYDIGFKFAQADQGVRANITAYPPAIDGAGIPRFMLDRIRIEAAYDGIKATGNCGGSFIGLIEVGALRKGIEINGALDFFHGTHWHFWPFGITTKTSLLNGVYYDGTTKAASIGQVESLTLDSLSTFRSLVEFTSSANPSIGCNIGRLQLDGDGARLTVAEGVISIDAAYSTKSAAATQPSLAVTGGEVIISQLVTIGSQASQDMAVSGTGTLVVNGGRINFTSTSNSAATVSAGLMALNNVHFSMPQSAFSAPHVAQSGSGMLQMNGCWWSGKGAGSGNAVSIGSDNARNNVSGNNFADWGYSVPSGSNLGTYGPNRTPLLSWTPAAMFATNGNFAPSYSAQVGKYRHEVGGIWFSLRVVFSTNAFTTASGGFYISGLPVANGGDYIGLSVNRAGNVDLATGKSWLSASIDPGSTLIQLLQSGDAVGVAGLGTAEIKPSTSNIEIVMSGFIPTY